MTYNPNAPTGSIPLDIDYLNLQTNFQQLDTRFGRDHVPFSTNGINPLSGYHKSIHFNPVSTVATKPPNNYNQTVQYPDLTGIPAITAGVGQLWSAEVNDGTGSADTGLYWLTGAGKKVALTRNFLPSHGANGYTYLPGGLILQWGVVSGLSGAWPTINTTLTFTTQTPANIAFTNACLNVLVTFTGTGTSSGDIGIISTSTTNFVWKFTGSASATNTGFYWQAIGY